MKLFFILSLIAASTAQAVSPDPGHFEWIKFAGNYKYISCEIKNNKPIWADDIENTAIEISQDFSLDSHNLQLVRWHKDSSYILLGRAIEKIDQGRYEEYDEEIQRISRTVISYATNDGVFGFLSWNFKELNVGWSSTELRMIDENTISYNMQIQHREDPTSFEETCLLKRFNK